MQLIAAILAVALNLPGTLKADATVCLTGGVCMVTIEPADVTVLGQDAERARVRLHDGTVLTTLPQYVVVVVKGCPMSLRAYNARSFCDGKPWPAN